MRVRSALAALTLALSFCSAQADQLICPMEIPASSKSDGWQPVFEGRLVSVYLTSARGEANNKNSVLCRRSEGSVRVITTGGSCELSEGKGNAKILFDSPQATLSACELPLNAPDNSSSCVVVCNR